MAITVYLCLKYPQKYDIFKYTVCKATGIYLENDFIPTKGHTEQNIKGNSKLIKDLNFEIAKDPSLGSGFCIGHSYFCGQDECTDEWMQSVVEYDILPMLEEYWFDEPAKIQKWQNILRGVFND